MTNYTKLFSSIVTSTIWTEDDTTRIVWITMLALADKNGEVQGSVPGLARIAGVSLDACQSALDKFLSPDKYSRTMDDEGRRIEKIDGGWFLLNHAKYRAMASKDDAILSNAERQRRHRAKVARNLTQGQTDQCASSINGNKVLSQLVTKRNGACDYITENRDIADTDTDTDTDTDPLTLSLTPTLTGAIAPDTKPTKHSSTNSKLHPGFNEFWTSYPRKIAKGDAEKAWSKIKPDLQAVLTALNWQTKLEDWTKDNGKYIPFPASYLNSGRYEDEKPAAKPASESFIKPKQLSKYDIL